MQLSSLPSQASIRALLARTNRSSLLPSISRTKYIGELEKHLSDYRSGNGNLPSNAPQEISRQLYSASSALSSFDPKASQQLAGYLTGLTYSQRARFINGVESATEASKQILSTVA